MFRLPVTAVVLSALASGCARETRSAKAPDASFRPWVTPPGYAWPPKVVAREDRLQPGARAVELSKTDPITTSLRPALPSDSLIPGGEQCLERLREQGVRFESLPEERGVQTPILLRGPVGGVDFWSSGGAMVVDCRMALALTHVAPVFASLGVKRARFSGAYVYRTSRKGRLSLHAYGLAIDVHAVSTDQEFSVSKDFARGLGDGCNDQAPVLNQLACRLRSQGLFRELLTPDYDADHHDHLHLGLAPLPGFVVSPSPVLAKAAAPSKPASGKRLAASAPKRAATTSPVPPALTPHFEAAGAASASSTAEFPIEDEQRVDAHIEAELRALALPEATQPVIADTDPEPKVAAPSSKKAAPRAQRKEPRAEKTRPSLPPRARANHVKSGRKAAAPRRAAAEEKPGRANDRT